VRGDLDGELARRREHERAEAAAAARRAPVAARLDGGVALREERLHDRQAERERLARPRLRGADDVAAVAERGGEALGLDGRGRGEAEASERAEEAGR
jgi:hypothetical protein